MTFPLQSLKKIIVKCVHVNCSVHLFKCIVSKYVHDLFPHYLIINKKLKDCDIIDPYEVPLFSVVENADEWPLIEHRAIVNYLAFSADTITLRGKTPTFTTAYPGYRRLL